MEPRTLSVMGHEETASGCPPNTTAGYHNPMFQEDVYQQKLERWMNAVGEDTLKQEGITEAQMRTTCETICTDFPRGERSGQLLLEPVVDNTPLAQRGVSMAWLLDAWHWMRNVTGDLSPVIPTRLFVALFVEPLVSQVQESRGDKHVPALYYFVPLVYRGLPEVFISHGWDSWMRHLLFYPRKSVPGSVFAEAGERADVFLWIDIFAIVQDPGSTLQQSEISSIGDVVRSIGNTCLIVPGHGSPSFALLPARRSWCCFEIAFTKENQLSARVGLQRDTMIAEQEGLSDAHTAAAEFHGRIIANLERLTCVDAESMDENEKKGIDALLEKELGLENADRIVRAAILQAFENRYELIGRAQHVKKLYQRAFSTFTDKGIV